MKPLNTKILLIILLCIGIPVFAQEITWYNGSDFPVEGRAWENRSQPYNRLTVSAETVVRPEVWRLGQNSAGLILSFKTDSPEIHLRWKARFNNHMPHMTDLGIKGFDLYCWSEKDQEWRWAGSAKGWNDGPNFKAKVATQMDRAPKFFRLYLPLYDAPDSLEIGIVSGATIRPYLHQYKIAKPIVFYGTSITQGGCASRPGLAYPAIIGRDLNVKTINLGFSGNGNMELTLANLLAEIDAACYVLDCLPNMTPEMVAGRVVPFVNFLRQAHPTTPIILVSTVQAANAWLADSTRILLDQKNDNLLAAYEILQKTQKSPLYLIRPEALKFPDNEGTVDGVHLNDLGFGRIADCLTPTIKKALKIR